MATTQIAPETAVQADTAPRIRALPQWLKNLLPLLLIAAPLAYAAYQAFPLYDDGWLALLMREHGRGIVRSTMPDRPVYAVFMTSLLVGEPYEKAILAGVTVALWIAFALVSARLWRRLSPALAHYAPLVATLVIAPIVATCQITTVVTSLQIIPPLLVFLGITLLLTYIEDGAIWRVLLTALLAAGGTLFSEYAVPAAAAGIVLLVRPLLLRESPERRRRAGIAAAALGISCLVGYAVYLGTADAAFRPSVSPSVATSTVRHNPIAIATNLATGTWRSVVGAYGTALGRVSIHWDSKSTLLAIAFAIPVVWALVFFCRKRDPEEESATPNAIDLLLPVVAVILGLLPVALMNRSTSMVGFGSRFLIPILPVAAAASVMILLYLTRPRVRWAIVACAGLICAYATITTVHTTLQEHALATEIGRLTRPRLSTSGGNTVVVVNRLGIDYELTAAASQTWTAAQSSKFWLYDEAAGRKALGSRQSCIQPPTISANQRQVQRSGPIDILLWVETQEFKIVSIEPYCRAAEKANLDSSNIRTHPNGPNPLTP